MTPMLSVLSVDDHPIYSQGLALALNAMKDSLVRSQHGPLRFEYADSLQAASARLQRQPGFNLLLLDMVLPDGNGHELLAHLQRHQPDLPVVILSANDSPSDVTMAISAGANGFISKSAPLAEVDQALCDVLSNKIVTPSNYSRATGVEATVQLDEAIPSLTPRQIEVLGLLARGLPNKRIASILQCQEDTVKSHLKALFSKLEAHNRTECVRRGFQLGLLGHNDS
ncbi:response regulator transcription factor [Allohahella marinimesophila]